MAVLASSHGTVFPLAPRIIPQLPQAPLCLGGGLLFSWKVSPPLNCPPQFSAHVRLVPFFSHNAGLVVPLTPPDPPIAFFQVLPRKLCMNLCNSLRVNSTFADSIPLFSASP